MGRNELLSLFKETFSDWQKDNCPKLAAALSFYTIFALAPLLLLVMSVAGLLFEQEAARGHLVYEMQGLIGTEGAKTVEAMIINASNPQSGFWAAIIGTLTLLIVTTGVFIELKNSLNQIWEVPREEQAKGLLFLIKERFFSFIMIIGVGFLLLLSLLISATLTAAAKYFGDSLPGVNHAWGTAQFLVSFLVITLLFAMMFKFLPDVKIKWKDVSVGALLTSLLFTLGKSIIALYLGRGAISSVYGAAGSFAVVMLWVYYSSQIFFLGAEFTQVYTRRKGSQMDIKAWRRAQSIKS